MLIALTFLFGSSLILHVLAAIPEPTQQEVDIASKFTVQGIPDYPGAWTAVGASDSDNFKSAYANYFLCKISTTAGMVGADSVGLYNLKLGFCHKTTNALDHELDAVPPDSSLDETAAGKSFQCASGFFIDKIKVVYETSDRAFTGLRWMCRHPTSLKIDFTNSDGWYYVGFSDNAASPQLHLMPEDESNYICGVKARRHSVGDDPSDAVGILGLQLLRCKFCESASNCLSGVTPKLKPSGGSSIPPLIYDSQLVAGADILKCMDFSSEDGDVIFGGLSMSSRMGDNTQGFLSFLGLKSATQSMAGDEWSWLKYSVSKTQYGLENCKFTPVVPSTGRRYIIASTKAFMDNIFFLIVDPYASGGASLVKEYYTNLKGRPMFQGMEPIKDIEFLTMVIADGHKLATLFVRASTSGNQIQLSRMVFDPVAGTVNMYYSLSKTSPTATDWGSAVAYDASTGSYYFGITHTWSSTDYATTLLRYLPQNPNEEHFESLTKSLTSDGYGISMNSFKQPAPGKNFYVIGAMAYRDRLVGIASKFIVPGYADEIDAQNGDFMFFGECS